MFQVSGAAVSWRSKKQTCIALSTAEAGYVALAGTVQEALWMRQFMAELEGNMASDATTVFEDNQSAISMTKNPQNHGQSNIYRSSTTSFVTK